MKALIRGIATVGLLAIAPLANAQTLNFNALSGDIGNPYTESGITLSSAPGAFLNVVPGSPNGTNALLASDAAFANFFPVRADFAGGASLVSVDIGDFNQDADTLFLEIYDAANVLLNSTSLLVPSTFTGMETLSLSSPNIAYAIFGATTPAQAGSSVYIDNLTIRPAVSNVPEPGSVALMSGMATLGGLVIRRRVRR